MIGGDQLLCWVPDDAEPARTLAEAVLPEVEEEEVAVEQETTARGFHHEASQPALERRKVAIG